MRRTLCRSTVVSPSFLGPFALLLIIIACTASATTTATSDPPKQLLLPKQLRSTLTAPSNPGSRSSSGQASAQQTLGINNFIDFEDGTDGAPIQSTIPGVEFITTQGYDWIYGDWRTGAYNGKYPSGQYYSNGNFFAWLGPNQGQGKIDFTNDDGTYARVGVSTYSGVYLDAYDTQGNLIDRAFGDNNLATGQLTFIEVHAPPGKYIDYLLVHDTGNYWLIDDLTTNASGVGPAPDLTVTSVELNQGVRGTQALVAGRPTIARVTVANGDPDEVADVRGTLDVFESGTKVASVKAGPITSKKNPPPEDIWAGKNTLNFKFTLAPGTYSLVVTLDPVAGEIRTDNNVFDVPGTYQFQATRGPLAGQAAMRVKVEVHGRKGMNDRPTESDATDGLTGMTRMYPLGQPGFVIASFDERGDEGHVLGDHDVELDLSSANERLIWHNMVNVFQRNWDNIMLVYSHDATDVLGKGQTSGKAFAIRNDPGYRRMVTAQEAGHTLMGAAHDPDCQTPRLPGIQVEDGAFDPFEKVSADFVQGTTTGERRVSYMYGCRQMDIQVWSLKARYEYLFTDQFDGILSGSKSFPSQTASVAPTATVGKAAVASVGPFLMGSVIGERDSVDLLPMIQYSGPFASSVFPGGPYTLEVIDEQGTPTTIGAFDLQGVHGVGSYEFVIPRPTELQSVRVLWNGTEVARQSMSQTVPQVHLLSPNGGEALGSQVDVSWTGEDGDGDSLTYTLLYSPDNGQSWELIETGLRGTGLSLNTDALQGSSTARFQVLASDGLATGGDVSDEAFSVPLKPPNIVIFSDTDRDTIPYGDDEEWTAQAWDPEDQVVDPQSIAWSSSQQGHLGSGTALSMAGLVPGLHEIVATVTDLDGNRSSTSRRVLIQDSTAPRVTLDAPNGKERLCSAEAFRIAWTASDNDRIYRVELELSTDGGATFAIPIGPAPEGASDFLWTPPTIDAQHCRIRVRAYDPSGNVGEDISNSEFIITAPPICSDALPPQMVAALSGTALSDCVRLLWEAPLDSTLRPLCSGDCSPWGQASSEYRIRYSLTPILEEADFASAVPVLQVPVPSSPGDLDSVTVCGLTPGSWHFFAVRAVDDSNNASPFDTVSIFVPLPIRADAGNDSTAECVGDPNGLTPVRLDGSRSIGSELRYAWAGTNVTFDDSTLISPTGLFALGTTQVVLRVSDGMRSSRDSVYVTVRDSAPPSATMSTNTSVCWPPNHKMMPVHVDLEVHDACDADPSVRLATITSSEPDEGLGDGDQPNDIQEASFGSPDLDFLLRAERSGTGNGRLYTICYDIVDQSGNEQRVCGGITVPHDQGGRAEVQWTWAGLNLILFGTSQMPAMNVVRDSIEVSTETFYRVPVLADVASIGDVDGDQMDDLSLSVGALPAEQQSRLKNADAVYARWSADSKKYLGVATPTSITAVDGDMSEVSDSPRVFAMQGPAAGIVTLRYVIPRAGLVRLLIYDVGGRLVARLVDGLQIGGVHRARFGGDETRVGSGVYLYRLEWQGKAINGKVVLVR